MTQANWICSCSLLAGIKSILSPTLGQQKELYFLTDPCFVAGANESHSSNSPAVAVCHRFHLDMPIPNDPICYDSRVWWLILNAVSWFHFLKERCAGCVSCQHSITQSYLFQGVYGHNQLLGLLQQIIGKWSILLQLQNWRQLQGCVSAWVSAGFLHPDKNPRRGSDSMLYWGGREVLT